MPDAWNLVLYLEFLIRPDHDPESKPDPNKRSNLFEMSALV